jgi:1,2-phenylacetyl-CoA epoxidase catalytic subunit
MVLEPAQFTDSRFAQMLGGERAAKFVADGQRFFSQQRGPEEMARLFAIFRVGEHHAVITIGDWLKDTPELEVKDGYARLIWDEARHTRIWTQRMNELIGGDRVEKYYPDPRRVEAHNAEYFRLWDEYGKADCLPKRLAYIYVVDAWAGFAYTTYLNYIDPVTKWHLQTILADERFHVSFGEAMAAKHVTSEADKEVLAREEEKIAGILSNVTDGFLRSEV